MSKKRADTKTDTKTDSRYIFRFLELKADTKTDADTFFDFLELKTDTKKNKSRCFIHFRENFISKNNKKSSKNRYKNRCRYGFAKSEPIPLIGFKKPMKTPLKRSPGTDRSFLL